MSRLLAMSLCVGLGGGAYAQDPNQKPDPVPELTASNRFDTHILGVVPNYATVDDPARPFQPIPVSEKYKLAARDAFDPFSWVITGVYAGVAQWGNNYAQFGQGLQGYGKRYGAAFADGAIADYLVEAILPSILHEDPRYFRMGAGNGWKRAGYAISRVIVTRTDAGARRFNNSEIEGNMMAALIANLYYPADNRTIGNTFEKFTLNVVSDAGFNVLKEFWPDMRRKILRKPEAEAEHSAAKP